VFASDEGPEELEANIIRFNKMLDVCSGSEETRAKCYGLTIAGMADKNLLFSGGLLIPEYIELPKAAGIG
jgi:hypothetical protein